MFEEMLLIAEECIMHPNRKSYWSSKYGMYVCPKSEEGRQAIDAQAQVVAVHPEQPPATQTKHPFINPKFKLVFLTAVGGTLLFIIFCLILSMLAGKEPPPLLEKVIMDFFDLAKIGFGAVVGLLGGKTLL